jgi:hypothetical protein
MFSSLRFTVRRKFYLRNLETGTHSEFFHPGSYEVIQAQGRILYDDDDDREIKKLNTVEEGENWLMEHPHHKESKELRNRINNFRRWQRHNPETEEVDEEEEQHHHNNSIFNTEEDVRNFYRKYGHEHDIHNEEEWEDNRRRALRNQHENNEEWENNEIQNNRIERNSRKNIFNIPRRFEKRIIISNQDTGEVIGHYPAGTYTPLINSNNYINNNNSDDNNNNNDNNDFNIDYDYNNDNNNNNNDINMNEIENVIDKIKTNNNNNNNSVPIRLTSFIPGFFKKRVIISNQNTGEVIGHYPPGVYKPYGGVDISKYKFNNNNNNNDDNNNKRKRTKKNNFNKSNFYYQTGRRSKTPESDILFIKSNENENRSFTPEPSILKDYHSKRGQHTKEESEYLEIAKEIKKYHQHVIYNDYNNDSPTLIIKVGRGDKNNVRLRIRIDRTKNGYKRFRYIVYRINQGPERDEKTTTEIIPYGMYSENWELNDKISMPNIIWYNEDDNTVLRGYIYSFEGMDNIYLYYTESNNITRANNQNKILHTFKKTNY